MPKFGSSFLGSTNDKKLSDEKLIRAIRFMVSSEYESTQLYMHLAESTDNELAVDVLRKIADEERVHAGEFLRLLYELCPDEKKFYEQGEKEVETLMNKSTPSKQQLAYKTVLMDANKEEGPATIEPSLPKATAEAPTTKIEEPVPVKAAEKEPATKVEEPAPVVV